MKRDLRVDILRTIAILLIILAHVSPPAKLFIVRTFDVPMMAILLGMSFYLSKKNTNYFSYLLKRFKRLVLPAWIYISLFFLIMKGIFFNSTYPYDWNTIKNTYNLTGGIGYVWIIGVFFALAVLSPGIYFFSRLFKKFIFKQGIILGLVLMQSFLSKSSLLTSNYLLVRSIPTYTGYALLCLVGIWMIQQNIQQNVFSGIIYTSLFLLLTIKNGFMSLQAFKYPPQSYYLFYGIAITFLLFSLVSSHFIQSLKIPNWFIWISTNSLQIYYWHIAAVTFFTYHFINIDWKFRFLWVVGIAIFFTHVQNKIQTAFKIANRQPKISNQEKKIINDII